MNTGNPLTNPQKTALQQAVHRATAGKGPGDRIPLPSLPDDTNPRTVRSLQRRGLVGEDKLLTPLGAEVASIMLAVDRGRRPVSTVRVTGGAV